MESCAPFDPGQGYALALTRYIDCQAALLGEAGYGALAANNSPVVIALGGLLTILIALQGYRLLLGEPLQIRDGVLLAAKIGLVLAFATQWSAYRAVVYNLAVETPREILTLLPGAGGGSGRSFPARLQGSYQAMAELTRPSPYAPPPLSSGADSEGNQAVIAIPAPTFSLAGNPLLIMAGLLLLVSGLATMMVVRLLTGLLLALGPLFIACFLFDSSRGWFEGWVRALAGTALASITTGLLLGMELSIVEPQLSALIEAMAVGTLPVLAPGEILVTIILFTLAMPIAMFLSVRIGSGFRVVFRGQSWSNYFGARARRQDVGAQEQTRGRPIAMQERTISRAAMISDSITSGDRWNSPPFLSKNGPEAARMIDTGPEDTAAPRPTPLGHSYRRVGTLRQSRSMNQRNGRP